MTDFILEILNGLTPGKYFAIILYIFLGVLFAYVREQVVSAKPIKRSGGFKLATWLQENWKRLLGALIGIHIVAIFGTKLEGEPLTIASAFAFGYTLDGILDMIFKRKE